jgi:hypothetical protein
MIAANPNEESAYVLGSPGFLGSLDVKTATRAAGWEAQVLANLYGGQRLRLNALFGYRYFGVYESLRLEQATIGVSPDTALGRFLPGHPQTPWPQTGVVLDQVDTHNRFHGGQIGLRAEYGRRSVFIEMDAKVALGSTVETTNITGQAGWIPHVPWLPPSATNVGVLANPTNIGRQTRSAFAVVPEGAMRVGYRMSDSSRVFVGYRFLYLSDLVRPGDQFDRLADWAPALGSQALGYGDRPTAPMIRSDFWTQGLTFGLEMRY